MIRCYFTFLMLFSMLTHAAMGAAEVKGNLRFSSQKYYPGDLIPLEMELSVPGGKSADFPNEHPDFNGLLPHGEPGAIKTFQSGETVIFTRSYHYLALDSLTVYAGIGGADPKGLTVNYTDAEGTHEYTFEVNAVSVQRIPVDTSAAIRAPYLIEAPQMERYFPIWLWIPIVLIVLLPLFWFLWKRNKRQSLDIHAYKNPLQWALPYVEAFEKEMPYEGSKAREKVIVLADVLRIYIARKTKYPAKYKLSSEWLAYMRSHEQYAVLWENLEASVRMSDAVKFAGYMPDAEEQREFLEGVKALLQSPAWSDTVTEKNGGVNV